MKLESEDLPYVKECTKLREMTGCRELITEAVLLMFGTDRELVYLKCRFTAWESRKHGIFLRE